MIERWQLKLIEKVTESPAFPAHDREGYRRVLKYLAGHSRPEERTRRTEKRIEEHFGPQNTKGSMIIERLDRALNKYFDSAEGRKHARRIEVARGRDVDEVDRYAVHFPWNKGGLPRLFWQPHLESFPTLLAYGVPLFVRNADQNVFTRRADVNVPTDVKKKDTDEICWPFVAHGDLLAVMELHQWLREQGVSVKFAAFKANDGLDVLSKSARHNDANVIVIGSIRVNGILDEYQKLELRQVDGSKRAYLPFRLRLYDVVEVDDHAKPVGQPHVEQGSTVPVVITRRAGAVRSFVTLIAGNHGRAVQRAAEILRNEDELHDLFQHELLSGWLDNMPAQFQILLRITVLAAEDLGGPFTVEKVWAAP